MNGPGVDRGTTRNLEVGVLPLQAVAIGLVVCGALVREVTAIAQRRQWRYRLTAVPAQYHNHPAAIAPAVEKILDAWVAQFDLILVGYADCGTRGDLDARLARYPQVARIPGAHCYEFFAGAAFHKYMDAEPGTFFLTDFLARHFDGLVWRGLGLDRFPELEALYFGNYRRVVYLRQCSNAESNTPGAVAQYTAYAEAAATRLKLPLEIVDTGLESLEACLVEMVTRAALAKISGQQTGALVDSTL